MSAITVRQRCDREHYARNRDYAIAQQRKRLERLSQIPALTRGRYTAAEDAVVMRDDLFTVEKCYLLGRSYASVKNRRSKLLSPKRSQLKSRLAHRRYRARHGRPFQGGRAVREPVCTVEGCEKPHCARGWCNTHYARWRANGTVVLASVKS